MIARKLRIYGRVQGVGYRDALRHEATKRAVAGWVRNRTDGTVEALVQGEPESVDRVIAWARLGPPAARVARVVVEAAEEADEHHASFGLRPTA